MGVYWAADALQHLAPPFRLQGSVVNVAQQGVPFFLREPFYASARHEAGLVIATTAPSESRSGTEMNHRSRARGAGRIRVRPTNEMRAASEQDWKTATGAIRAFAVCLSPGRSSTPLEHNGRYTVATMDMSGPPAPARASSFSLFYHLPLWPATAANAINCR